MVIGIWSYESLLILVLVFSLSYTLHQQKSHLLLVHWLPLPFLWLTLCYLVIYNKLLQAHTTFVGPHTEPDNVLAGYHPNHFIVVVGYHKMSQSKGPEEIEYARQWSACHYRVWWRVVEWSQVHGHIQVFRGEFYLLHGVVARIWLTEQVYVHFAILPQFCILIKHLKNTGVPY